MSDYGTPPPPPSGGAPAYGGPVAGPPPNYLVLAIVSLLCCWPVGIPAVVFAARVNSKWAQGDHAGAAEASRKAKTFAIIALVLGVIVAVVYGLMFAMNPTMVGGGTTGY
jgi:uncharacterized protein YqhQ